MFLVIIFVLQTQKVRLKINSISLFYKMKLKKKEISEKEEY
jgi:hypothetical protein